MLLIRVMFEKWVNAPSNLYKGLYLETQLFFQMIVIIRDEGSIL